MTKQSLSDAFEEYGRVWLRNAVSEDDLTLFDRAASISAKAGQRLDGSTALDAALSEESSVVCAVRRLVPKALPVRVIAFNKSDNANWGVPWHQDRVIAVTEKADVAEYKNWSHKSGTWHCEPPESILAEMLFVRVHLDDTDDSNGAMEIAIGSHAAGVFPSESAERVAKTYPIETCSAKRGDVLILKMLTLHASKPAKMKSGRRVLRLDFSTSQLPSPLSWHSPFTKT
ncbi:phytanoyl-CoA dioxygenase family protein [Tritonibacter scottomollicae]|uniref:phytanoyl-CoA dioxygenase family protein n=1 Tax=Tritonibacter scottomollicae TaxID=483013 RepID=UPI003AA87487